MYRPIQGRRLLVPSMVMAVLLSSWTAEKAEANPLLWSLAGLAVNEVRYRLTLSHVDDKLHSHMARDHVGVDRSIVALQQQRLVWLQIPPGIELDCVEIRIAQRNLSTGATHLVAVTNLSVSTGGSKLTVPIAVTDVQRGGLFRYEAVIPELAEQIYIGNTETVLM